jgi:hypothetical protein
MKYYVGKKLHDKKVKQVVEAWTYDGSNILLDKAGRNYTISALFYIK